MDAPLDPQTVDALGQILGKGGSAASVLLAYFGFRIFRAIVTFLGEAKAYLDKFYWILDRLDRHMHPDQSTPMRPPAPDTRPLIAQTRIRRQ